MADEIKKLQIQIESDTGKTNQQLDALASKLNRISKTLSGIKAKELTKFSNEMNKLSKINTANLNSMASSMILLQKSVSNMAAVSKSAGAVSSLAKSVVQMASTISGMGNSFQGASAIINSAAEIGSSFAAANEKANIFKQTILGLGQLNMMGGNTQTAASDGGDTSAGEGGDSPSGDISGTLAGYAAAWNSTLEQTVITAQAYADRISGVFNNMWLVIKSGDYVGLTEAVTAGVNYVFETINSVFNWETIGPGITSFVVGYVNAVNSLAYSIDWTLIGQTVLNGANVVLNALYTFFSQITQAVQQGFPAAFDVAGAVKVVGDIFGSLDWGALAGGGVTTGAGKLAEFFGNILTDVLSNVIEEILTELLTEKLAKLFTDIGSDGNVLASIGGLGGQLSQGLSTAIGGISPVTLGIVGGIALVTVGIMDLWSTSDTFRENVGNMLDIIGTAFDNAKTRIWDEGLLILWGNLQELFGSLYTLYEESGLKSIFEMVVTGIGYIVSNVFAGLMEGISVVIQFITGIASVVVGILTGLINGAIGPKDQILLVWDWITQKFMGFQEFLGNVFSTDWTVKFGAFGEVVNGFFGSVSGIVDGLKKVFSGIIEFVTGVFTGDWGKAWDGIKNIFGGIWDSFVGIVKAPINMIIGLINGLLSGAESMVNSLAKALSFKIDLPDFIKDFTGMKSFKLSLPTVSIPKIPFLANGGMFPSRGQLFVARERGPELVTQFGNKTAVMNNDQVLNSVSDEIGKRFAEAMFMRGGLSSENDREPIIELTIMEDCETAYKRILKGKKKHERRYSATVSI